VKLHVLSDLHLEFSSFEPPATDAKVVVLAGDIAQGNKGVYWARQTFPDSQIIYVPGNHEYYGSRRPETLRLLRIAGKQNSVQVLDGDEWIFDGVRFLGATLWTDFEYFGPEMKTMAKDEGARRLNDFRIIDEADGLRFSPQRSIELHEKSLAWLTTKLDEPFDGKTVVITHHLPSVKSVAARFIDTPLSACFVSHLDPLFGKMNLWIHGHTHDNSDYEANGTRVICNPRGYVTPNRGAENIDFKPGLVIEV
jgi:predicted phosphodiesterase